MVDAVPILEDLRVMVRADGRPDRAIAAAAGIHVTTFSTFMSGKRGLSIDTAERLAEALGRPLQFGETPAKPKGSTPPNRKGSK